MIKLKKNLKNRIYYLIIAVVMIIFVAGCKNNHEEEIELPNIPEGYVIDKARYLSTGEGIYVLIKNEEIDYEEIQKEICNGNAEKIKEQYQTLENKATSTEQYVAVKNIISVADIYLGNYNQAFEGFNDAIKFAEENTVKDKNEILAALYNNVVIATFYLPKGLIVNEQLKKAAKLCEEPYTGLVIAVNQIGQEETSLKLMGRVMGRADELIKRESEINDSIGFVSFLAVGYWAKGYERLGQQKRAVDMLGEYIMKIPDSAEYNLIKSNLLGLRGNYHKDLGELELAIADIQDAIFYARKTVNDNFRRVAIECHRIGICYGKYGEWEKALEYLELANAGYANWMPASQGNLYFNEGYASLELKEYEKAKQNFLKAYWYEQLAVEESDKHIDEEDIAVTREKLHEVYSLQQEYTLPFDEWLDQGLVQIEEEVEEEETEEKETK